MKGFYVHPATARSKPDSFPDIVKTCWFVMKEKWFDNLQRKGIKKYAHNDKKIVLLDNATVENKFQDTWNKNLHVKNCTHTGENLRVVWVSHMTNVKKANEKNWIEIISKRANLSPISVMQSKFNHTPATKR